MYIQLLRIIIKKVKFHNMLSFQHKCMNFFLHSFYNFVSKLGSLDPKKLTFQKVYLIILICGVVSLNVSANMVAAEVSC